MSREEKEKIHLEIDEKMSQLEQTGLSKEEVLYNRPEGIPLANDHFFQYLKSNRIAREMLITADEPFNADRVIEIALKQDIGPDPSMGLTRKKNPKLKEDMPLSFELSQAKRTFDRKHLDETLKEDDFDYRTNYLDKLKVFLNAEKSRPVSFIRPPLMRSQIRKKYMIKTIKKSDVHWKNLPLLTRFINEAGKLMTRYQSRLPTSVHRKLAKTVKHARNMGLLPFNDFIKPEHKVPFTSIYTEFLHDTTKVVDQKTGTIKLVYLPTDKDKFSYENFGSATDSNKQNAKQ